MIKKIFLVILIGISVQASAQAHSRFSLYPIFSVWNFLEMPHGVPNTLNGPENLFGEAEIPADVPIDFSTERMGEGALLTWDLPRPEDVSSLIIEGSEDGTHFIGLESLERAEAGILDIFYDAAPQDRRYYRLIANYTDGNQKITPARMLAAQTRFSAALDEENASVLVVTGPERVELYDLRGQIITAATPWEGKCEIELAGLAHGPYLVRAGANRQVFLY